MEITTELWTMSFDSALVGALNRICTSLQSHFYFLSIEYQVTVAEFLFLQNFVTIH